MAIEITQPATYPIVSQLPAAEALVELIKMFGHLPSAYLTIHRQFAASAPPVLGVQVDTPSAFEAWRTALTIPSADIDLHEGSGDMWLSVNGVFCGVLVRLTGFGVQIPEVASPQADEGSAVAA